jgi:hypothetical protein
MITGQQFRYNIPDSSCPLFFFDFLLLQKEFSIRVDRRKRGVSDTERKHWPAAAPKVKKCDDKRAAVQI